MRILLLLLTCLAQASFAYEGQPVMVVTQWDTHQFRDPIVSLFTENPHHKMQISGSGCIFTYDDHHGCTDVLSKMFQYPLGQMRKDNYITQDFYEFLLESKGQLDPRQIIFLNKGKVSSTLLPGGRSIMPNLLGIFSNETRHHVASLQKMADQWFNVDGSMWVVRGHVPEKTADGFFAKKAMPWEDHPEFHAYKHSMANDELHWEFGRANREAGTDFNEFMQMGTSVAVKDALALKMPLSKGKVHIHTKNRKMADHVISKYGFKEVAAHGTEDYLLVAPLDQLVERLGTPDFLLNQAVMKSFFPRASAAQLLEGEHKILRSLFLSLDDLSSSRAGEGIYLYNGAFHPQMSKTFLELEPRFYQLPNPGQFGMAFNEGMSIRHEMSAKMVGRKGSTDWGVADLSEQRFKEDPHYLERIITEVTQLNKKNIRSLPLNDPTAKPEVFRGFFMATPSKPIADRARAMGATVKEMVVEAKGRVEMQKSGVQYQATLQTYYTLEFDAARAKAITQDFSVSAPPPSFKEGLKQVQHDFLTAF